MDTMEIRVTHLLLSSKQPEKNNISKMKNHSSWRWLEKINVLNQCNYISERNISSLYCDPRISLSET